MTFGHVIAGPLDLLIELGLPLGIFAALWWWSTRRGRASPDQPLRPQGKGPLQAERSEARADQTKSDRDRG